MINNDDRKQVGPMDDFEDFVRRGQAAQAAVDELSAAAARPDGREAVERARAVHARWVASDDAAGRPTREELAEALAVALAAVGQGRRFFVGDRVTYGRGRTLTSPNYVGTVVEVEDPAVQLELDGGGGGTWPASSLALLADVAPEAVAGQERG